MLECTDPRLSARLQHPTQMQRFLEAVLSHCALYPNNIAFVLKRLGDAQTAGLQRLREISRFSKTIRVGHTSTCSVCCWCCKGTVYPDASSKLWCYLSSCGLQVDMGVAVSPSLLLTCALLHLVTLPPLMNSVLKQFYNPILTTIADNLDMQAMCEAVEELDTQYTKSMPQVRCCQITRRQRLLQLLWVTL